MSFTAVCLVAGLLRLEDALLPHMLFLKNTTARATVTAQFEECRKAGLIAAAGNNGGAFVVVVH